MPRINRVNSLVAGVTAFLIGATPLYANGDSQWGYVDGEEAINREQNIDYWVNEYTRDFLDFNGRKILSGRFHDPAGNGPLYVAEVVPGNVWNNIGSCLNGFVLALAEYDGKLIAVGDFNACGEKYLEGAAYWDGKEWYKMGALPGLPEDLEVRDKQLFAEGTFDHRLGDSGEYFRGVQLENDGWEALWSEEEGEWLVDYK